MSEPEDSHRCDLQFDWAKRPMRPPSPSLSLHLCQYILTRKCGNTNSLLNVTTGGRSRFRRIRSFIRVSKNTAEQPGNYQSSAWPPPLSVQYGVGKCTEALPSDMWAL